MIYATDDELTGDSLSVELECDRVLIRSAIEGRERLLILVRREDAVALGHALIAALDRSTLEGRTICL